MRKGDRMRLAGLVLAVVVRMAGFALANDASEVTAPPSNARPLVERQLPPGSKWCTMTCPDQGPRWWSCLPSEPVCCGQAEGCHTGCKKVGEHCD